MATPHLHSQKMLSNVSFLMVGKCYMSTMAIGRSLLYVKSRVFSFSISDYAGIYKAIAEARQEKSKPTIVRLRTTIGYGSKQQGTHGVHGSRQSSSCLTLHFI